MIVGLATAVLVGAVSLGLLTLVRFARWV
jgi:hypothetical protein